VYGFLSKGWRLFATTSTAGEPKKDRQTTIVQKFSLSTFGKIGYRIHHLSSMSQQILDLNKQSIMMFTVANSVIISFMATPITKLFSFVS
jgi:hypothetical protein